MKSLKLVIWTVLTLAVWAEPSPPILPSSTLALIAETGWMELTLNNPNEVGWQRGDSRLLLASSGSSPDGEKWRLGNEKARLTSSDQKLQLHLPERGWTLSLEPPSPQARQELLKLASTLSQDGTVRLSFGQSVEGRPLEVVRLGTGADHTLFFGVFHGDEPAGEVVLHRLIEYLIKTPNALTGRSVTICPVTNPDGLLKKTRVNARGVDLNRNFPTKNWSDEERGTRYWGGPAPASEPETQAVLRLLEWTRPNKIVTLHAPLHNVNYDGPAEALAKRMSRLNGYPVEPEIGYPTPGSFGTYTGRERKIPTITLEFPEGDGMTMWLANRSALLEAIGYDP